MTATLLLALCPRSSVRLIRCLTRQALANERVQINVAGQLVQELKKPWRNGMTHLVMSPLEFMQRLVTLMLRRHMTAKLVSRRIERCVSFKVISSRR